MVFFSTNVLQIDSLFDSVLHYCLTLCLLMCVFYTLTAWAGEGGGEKLPKNYYKSSPDNFTYIRIYVEIIVLQLTYYCFSSIGILSKILVVSQEMNVFCACK
jgi:hypothetical protein